MLNFILQKPSRRVFWSNSIILHYVRFNSSAIELVIWQEFSAILKEYHITFYYAPKQQSLEN